MSAVLYRLDGTARTYTDLFPVGSGAVYDDYGVRPYTGPARSVQLASHGHAQLGQTARAACAGRRRVLLEQTASAHLRQPSTVQLPKE
jgi:hypothetical protein